MAWLRLGRLSAEATVQLVRGMIGAEGERIGPRVYEETEGNPLFAVETIRSLVEGGALVRVNGASSQRLVIPETVQAVIGARVGARRRFEQALTPDTATGARFSERTGLFQEKEFFRYRTDRGTLTFETEVLEVCRPREFVLFRNSRWQIRNPLGCR